MKILMVVEAFGGGIYTFLNELCNKISDDYKIKIIYSIRDETPKDFRNDFNDKIEFINLKMNREINPINDLRALLKLSKIIKVEKPDIVHLHSSKAGFLGRLACFLIRYNGKVFYNPHGFSFLRQDIQSYKRKLYFILEKIASKFGGTIISVSESEYMEAKKISDRVKLINNAIDKDKIQEIQKKYDNNIENSKKISIGTIGRISYAKNPILFANIAKDLMEYNFIWIGDGELREHLDFNNIIVTGWKKHEEAVIEALKLDIYIQTSLWEGMPIALLEAMSMGKPGIVTNVSGNKDIIKHGYNGFIANSKEEFIEYINMLATNEKLRKEMGQNAAKYVADNYSIDKMADSYIKLYNSN